jgi:methionyl-tRNA formyltransferase
MARVIVIGGIESTYYNAQTLHECGEEIVMFYTRGGSSPGWEGVDMVDESTFPFASVVPRTIVTANINDHVNEMRLLRPDAIYSLGWQQMFGRLLLSLCKVIGIHESLLPEGAGVVPIANAILHGVQRTGCTLFWVDGGVDTGPIIGQLAGLLDPRKENSTQLYREAMQLGSELLRMYIPHINSGKAPSIPQDNSRRVAYRKIDWSDWPDHLVRRARVYPYV